MSPAVATKPKTSQEQTDRKQQVLTHGSASSGAGARGAEANAPDSGQRRAPTRGTSEAMR